MGKRLNIEVTKFWLLLSISAAVTVLTVFFSFSMIKAGIKPFIKKNVISMIKQDMESKVIVSKGKQDIDIDVFHQFPYVKKAYIGKIPFKISSNVTEKVIEKDGCIVIYKKFIFPDGSVPAALEIDCEKIDSEASVIATRLSALEFFIVLLLQLSVLFAVRDLFLLPLRDIKKEIDKVSAGKLVHLPVGKNDEFGKIRKKINEMIDNIKDRTVKEDIMYQFIHLLTAGKGFNGEFLQLIRKLLVANRIDGVLIGITKGRGNIEIRAITLSDKSDKTVSLEELDGIQSYLQNSKKEIEFTGENRDFLSDEEKALGINYLIGFPLSIFSKNNGFVIFYRKRAVALSKEEKRYLGNIAKAIAVAAELKELIESLEKKIRQEKELLQSTVRSMVRGIEVRDSYTKGHSERVAYLSKEIAKSMGLSEKEQERIYLAALLHDIGKIGIPDSILLKPGRLTKEEYEIIKLHPVLSYELLKDINPISDILNSIKFHHERIDGTGYPEGLKGNQIPFGSRIIAVADSFDAMTSDRIYKKGMNKEEALKEIISFAGDKYDSEVVHSAISVLKKDIPIESKGQSFEQLSEIEQRRLDYFFRDSLTGSHNRNYLSVVFNSCKEEKTEFKILCLDILGLRKINLEKGWEYGDKLLKDVKDKLEEIFSPASIIRYSGDNFVLFLDDKLKDDWIREKVSKIEEELGGVILSLHILKGDKIETVEQLMKTITEIETKGY